MLHSARGLIAGALSCVLLHFHAPAHSAPGDWDRTFGQDGRVSLLTEGVDLSVATWAPQPDGKIVAAGRVLDSNGLETSEYLVARFDSSGSLDAGFGSAGVYRFDGFKSLGLIEIALQADGKIVIAAQGAGYFIRLIRLEPDGGPDFSFGSSGSLELHFPRAAFGPRMRIAADGSIIVVARLGDWLTSPTAAIMRVTASGAVDTTFGAGGVIEIDSPQGHLDPYTMALQPDGAVVIAGTLGQLNNGAPYVARVTANGRRDESFGVNGVALPDFLHGDGYISELAPTVDGKVYAAGERRDSVGSQRSFLARLNADGSLDPTFGSNGRIIVTGVVAAMIAEPDGRVVLSGAINELRQGLAWLARYNADGSPDEGFGWRGRSRTDFSLQSEWMNSVLHDLVRSPDGSYRALVRSFHPESPSPRTSFAIARFLAEGAAAGVVGLRDSAPGAVWTETDARLLMLVYRTGGADGAVSVQYRTVSDTATASADFAEASGSFTFQDGEVGLKWFEVEILDDGVHELQDEQFFVELFAPSGAGLSFSRLAIRIQDDQDPGSVVGFVTTQASAIESGDRAVLLVERTGDLRTPISVEYAAVSGTATEGADFPTSNGSVAWPAGEGGVRVIEAPLIDDALAEAPEEFSIVLSAATQSTRLTNDTAVIQVVDDDEAAAAPMLGFSARHAVITEGAPSITLGVHRLGDPQEALSADWNTTFGAGSSSATSGQDYTAASGELSWAAGDATPQTIVIPLLDDQVGEPLEHLAVNIFAGDPASNLDGGAAVVWLVDDDVTPTQPIISIGGDAAVAENAGSLAVHFTLSGAPANPVGVRYAVYAQTASRDDLSILDGLRTWQAGDTASQVLFIPIENDALDEIDETFTLELWSPTGGALLATRSATFTIVDDDPTPAGAPGPIAPGVELTPATIRVGESEHAVVFEVSRIGDPGGDLYAYCSPTRLTASSPADFVSAARILAWDPGEIEPQAIDIQINGDGAVEAEESLTIECTPRMGTTELSSQEATVTIVDDDGAAPAARIAFTRTSETVQESAVSATVQVARTGDTSIASSVEYATFDASASTADYAAASGVLTWLENDASARMITIFLTPDSQDEADETFSIVLRAPSAGSRIDTATAVITIVDDDAAAPSPEPAPDPSPSPGSRGEGGGGPVGLLLLAALLAATYLQRRDELPPRAS